MGPAATKWNQAAEDPAAVVIENKKLRDTIAQLQAENQELLDKLRGQVDPRGCGDDGEQCDKKPKFLTHALIQLDDANKEIERLKAELAKSNASVKEHEEAFAIQLRDVESLLATISALRAELNEAPRWVPVGEFNPKERKFYFVSGILSHFSESRMCECFYEEGKWFWGGFPFSPTDVLVGLCPPKHCDACIDTGFEVDTTKPLVESPTDCLVASRQCANDTDGIDSCYKCHCDGGCAAIGGPFQQVVPDADAATKSQCRDMLGQDVIPSDVMWDTKIKELYGDPSLPEYKESVRCPRPGEPIKEFAGWREMAKAMQESGAAFFLDGTPPCAKFDFSDPVSRYSRSLVCTWKGPR